MHLEAQQIHPVQFTFVRREGLVFSTVVFQRIKCPLCTRLIAVNGNGQLRTHFCPHRHLCEPQRCRACEQTQLYAGIRNDHGMDLALIAALAGVRQ
jgi:hypothetical protein